MLFKLFLLLVEEKIKFMKKILIIGSNSFAGSDFTNYLLNRNFKVYGVSRSLENNGFSNLKELKINDRSQK